jgi:hypothetical protein
MQERGVIAPVANARASGALSTAGRPSPTAGLTKRRAELGRCVGSGHSTDSESAAVSASSTRSVLNVMNEGYLGAV